MENNSEVDLIDAMDTPVGKVIMDCLLLKNGKQLVELLGDLTLGEFIDERYDIYVQAASEVLGSEDYQNGGIGHNGVAEIARAAAFEGLD